MPTEAFSENDLRLINALQVAPRISWAAAARAIGGTPQSLALRWQRLRARGLAWIAVYPNPSAGEAAVAIVEVDCLPARRAVAARALCADPRVVSVEEAARGCDLVLTVITRDLAAMTVFLLDELSQVAGVAHHRSFLATAVHRQGSAWRLRALSPAEAAAAAGTAGAAHAAASRPLPEGLWPVIDALARDGRATAADVARATGSNPAAVRRQVARVCASPRVVFRCDMAQGYSRWPVLCNWHARVPVTEHERTVAALATLPGLRLCLSTTGYANMYLTVWVASLPDVLHIERHLTQHLPWLELVDSSITLRNLKRMGWLLRPDGRCTGEVVVPDALRA